MKLKPSDVSPLISKKEINKRVRVLGKKITENLQKSPKEVIALCVLNGAYIFFSDLTRSIKKDLICDFISVSSYHKSKSSGKIELILNIQRDLKNKQVLLIEDIIDTGLTLSYLQKKILSKKPEKLITITLIKKINTPLQTKMKRDKKPELKPPPYHVDYTGFETQNHFLVGYGMDYHGFFRHLPYIGQIKNIEQVEKLN